MTPEYRIEIEERIKEYFKSFDDIGQIINIKCEETFSDLGNDVNVWNVKTKLTLIGLLKEKMHL